MNRGTLGVNNLPRVVARIMPRPESNPPPLDHKSDALPLNYRASEGGKEWRRCDGKRGGEEGWERERVGKGKVGEGLCSFINSIKSLGRGPSLTLTWIDTPTQFNFIVPSVPHSLD